jgi:hypothetical protein
MLILARYVFDNYTWDRTSGDFSTFNGKPIPARVPLTALLSGLFPSSHLYARVRGPDLSPFQAPSPATHFRHPQVAHPRLFPSFLTKSAQIVLLLIQARSMARWGMRRPRQFFKRGLTSSNGRRIDV